jgi:hypothetical protein
MGQANGYVLRLPEDRQEVFEQCVEAEEIFGQPVPVFLHSRAVPLICSIVSRENQITTFAQGRRGVRGGTGLRRLPQCRRHPPVLRQRVRQSEF